MRGNSDRRNREALRSSAGDGPVDRRGKAGGRNPLVHDRGESDSGVVPEKGPNRGGSNPPAEVLEGRPLAKGNERQEAAVRTQRRGAAPSDLARVREAAKRDSKARFTALLHHLTVDLLRDGYRALNPKAVPGVDGVTWNEYGVRLEERLLDLHDRVHSGRYRVQPSKRAYIAKEDGKQRPLGIAALDDKIVQMATVTILNQIYEVDFRGFSYGFRPGRSQHQALDALVAGLERKNVNWVLDADIRGFFDAVSHEWLLKFLEHRIADRRVLRLVCKWLRAGVSEDGKWSETTVGTPQGAVVSPLLANVYLHYVLDLWVEQWRKRHAKGDVIVLRYADDVVLGFQHQAEAEQFLRDLHARFQEFGLSLHSEKTRLIEFGRHAISRRSARGEGKPETFHFLGFTHICGQTYRGKHFVVWRQTMRKRMRTRLAGIKADLQRRRHDPVPDQGAWLRSVVRGYFQYHAVPGNFRALASFRALVRRTWFRSLRRRSQRSRLNWDRFDVVASRWLPRPKILHPWPLRRFDARTRGGSRMR